jgi:programmed cell death 6-interacting protein
MAEYFAPLPFRRLEQGTDWRLVLKFLSKHYKDDLVRKCTAPLDRLSELRKTIASTCQAGSKQPVTEGFIESTLKEYAKLLAIAQLHFPLCTGEIKGLVFNWIESLDGKPKTSLNSNVELMGIIINMAAASTVVGANDAANKSVEGIKSGFKYFSTAAGLYQFASGLANKINTNEVTGELAAPVLNAYAQYCLAMGHHCSYLKAEIEMRDKHSVLSKLAMQASREYSQVESMLRGYNGCKGVEQCSRFALAAGHLFAARASWHLATEALAKEDYGVGIARLRDAEAALGQAQGSCPNTAAQTWVGTVAAPIHKMASDAQTQNDTVYFERVAKGLPPPEALGRNMAKILPADGVLAWPKETPDPFKDIIPMHVASVANDFRSKMTNEINMLTAWLQSHREGVRQSVSQLGVVAAIDQAEHSDRKQGRVPDAIRNKIITLRTNKDGSTFKVVDVLVNMLGHIANAAAAVESTSDKIEEELNKEIQEDLEACKMYGEKVWYGLRRPSSQLPDYQNLKKIIIELKGSVDTTISQPLEQLKGVLQQNLRELSRLDWPMEDLDALMPYSKTKHAKEMSKQVLLTVEKLKGALDRFTSLEKEENDLRSQIIDLLKLERLTEALASVPPDKHGEILESLKLTIEERITQLRSTASLSDQLLEECQQLMISMAEVKSDDPVADEIQRFCSSLDAACGLYQSLHQQLSDVSTNAAGLMDRANSCLTLAQSYTLGRSLEASDFRQSLDEQLAKKMKEVEQQRLQSEETKQSRERQAELQRQIAELEAVQNQGRVPGSGNAPAQAQASSVPSSGANPGQPTPGYQYHAQPQPGFIPTPTPGPVPYNGQGYGQPGHPTQGQYPPSAAPVHVMDTLSHQQQNDVMDDLFAPKPKAGGGTPYVYQPSPSAGASPQPSAQVQGQPQAQVNRPPQQGPPSYSPAPTQPPQQPMSGYSQNPGQPMQAPQQHQQYGAPPAQQGPSGYGGGYPPQGPYGGQYPPQHQQQQQPAYPQQQPGYGYPPQPQPQAQGRPPGQPQAPQGYPPQQGYPQQGYPPQAGYPPQQQQQQYYYAQPPPPQQQQQQYQQQYVPPFGPPK